MGEAVSKEMQPVDWTHNKEPDIRANTQLVDRLRYLVYRHLYEEGVFYQTTIGEKRRIVRKIRKLKGHISHRNL